MQAEERVVEGVVEGWCTRSGGDWYLYPALYPALYYPVPYTAWDTPYTSPGWLIVLVSGAADDSSEKYLLVNDFSASFRLRGF